MNPVHTYVHTDTCICMYIHAHMYMHVVLKPYIYICSGQHQYRIAMYVCQVYRLQLSWTINTVHYCNKILKCYIIGIMSSGAGPYCYICVHTYRRAPFFNVKVPFFEGYKFCEWTKEGSLRKLFSRIYVHWCLLLSLQSVS